MGKRFHVIGSGAVPGGRWLHTLSLDECIRAAMTLAPSYTNLDQMVVDLKSMDLGDQWFVQNMGWIVCLQAVSRDLA